MTISIQRASKGYRLEATQRIPRPITEVFPFFADARNLESITPPSLRFRILTPPPITMAKGTLIDYRIRINGVAVRWRTEITAWEPPVRFVDEQQRGPYRWWTHEHTFRADGDETVMNDRVDYGVPGGALIHRTFVGPSVRRIFEYRAERLRERFGT